MTCETFRDRGFTYAVGLVLTFVSAALTLVVIPVLYYVVYRNRTSRIATAAKPVVAGNPIGRE